LNGQLNAFGELPRSIPNEVNTRAMAAADFFAMTMRLPEASQSTGSCVSEELLPVLEGSRLPILLASARAHLAVRWPDTRLALWQKAANDWVLHAGQCDARPEMLPDGVSFFCMPKIRWQAVPYADEHALWLVASASEAESVEFGESLSLLARALSVRVDAAVQLAQLTSAVDQLAKAERLQRALYAITELAGSDVELPDMLAVIHRIVGELMYAENFFIALLDAERHLLRFPYFRDTEDSWSVRDAERVLDLAGSRGSLTEWVIRHGETLMGPSRDLQHRVGLALDDAKYGPQSVDWLGVPLRRGEDIFGAVVVQSYDPTYRYGDDERALLGYVAQHISTALERRFARDSLERHVAERTDELRIANLALRDEIQERHRAERLQAALFRIAELGSSTVGLGAFFENLHLVVSDLLHATNFYIALHDVDSDMLSFPYSVDQHDRQREPRRLARGMTEYVLREGRAVLADRAVIDGLSAQNEVQSHGTHARSWLGVPLICSDQVVGVLAVQSYDDSHRYTPRDQELLTFVSWHIANALERKRAAASLQSAYAELEVRVEQRTEALYAANRDLREQIAERERAEWQLRHAALHDPLTGLPNRTYLMARLTESIARHSTHPEQRYAVLFLDLDRFKVVNDSVGHLVGDELLKEAGARIAANVGRRGTIARLGGDEFAVLVDSVREASEVTDVAERIILAMEEPFRVVGKELYSSTSIGVVLADSHYATPAEILRDADVALYRAKAKGRRCYALFDDALRQKALHQLELESQLRRALQRGEFEPFYQPIIELESGSVAGFEALLRWRHPSLGMLAPSEFLTQAEESGLLEAIDWLLYECVFAQIRQFLQPQQYVSINVGARHLRSASFVARLRDLLASSDVPAHQLQIEVTERSLFEQPEFASDLLESLRGFGVRVALDDFGTGYSSLSYLHQFPIQVLKIDRSFVDAIGRADAGSALAVLNAICVLGQSLGMDVVAEGIETRDQWQTVRELGCRFGQGFLLATPQSLQTTCCDSK
jgi:diguanylate cyclase (GGDEF)-like protein